MSRAQIFPITPSPSFPPLAYQGTPVLTTDMLAQAYGVEVEQIRQNFKRNRARFIEEKHFFQISGNELKEFKDCVTNCHTVQIDKRTASLTLWPERGAARHAKMLNTDKAWEVFELLEETFFAVVKPAPVPELPSADAPLTADQQCTLQAIVRAKVEALPAPQQSKGTYPKVWSRFNNHFRIARYSQLPQARMSEAVTYLTRMDILPPAQEQLALEATPAVLDEQVQKIQSLVNEVKQRGNEFMSSIFTLQSALRRPCKSDAAVSALSKALERNLPTFGTAIGMNISALCDLLDVYNSTLTGPTDNASLPAPVQPCLPATGDPYEDANARLEEMRRKYHALRDEAGSLLVEVMMDDERRMPPQLLVKMPTPITDMTESFFRNSIDLHQSWSSNPVLLIRELHNALGLKRTVPLDKR